MTPAAADFDPELMRLFDQYVHGDIDRRGFLDKAGRVAAAGGTSAAAVLAAWLLPVAPAPQPCWPR